MGVTSIKPPVSLAVARAVGQAFGGRWKPRYGRASPKAMPAAAARGARPLSGGLHSPIFPFPIIIVNCYEKNWRRNYSMLHYRHEAKKNLFKNMDEKLKKIFKRSTILAAYLFGSRASGKAGTLSDFDFAILFDHNLTKEEREKIRQQIYCELSSALDSNDIDLISLNDTSQPVLLYEAVFHGKALYTRNIDQRAAFEMYVRKLYEDTRHIRKTAAYYQEKRIQEGTFGKIIEQ